MRRPEEITLPDCIDTERLVLGAGITDREAFPQIISILTADDFALEKHKTIFRHIQALYEDGKHIDRITLIEALTTSGRLASVDGYTYIAALDDGLPTLHNLEAYCALVRKKSVLRRAIQMSADVIHRIQSGEESEDILASAEKLTSLLTQSSTRKLNARTVDEIIDSEGGLNQFLSPDARPGIHLPFAAIHETLSGLRRGKLIVLGARPAVGKTAFATQAAEHAADNGNNVVFVSVEMKARELLHRSITGRAHVSAYQFRTGKLSVIDRHSVVSETSALAGLGSKLLLVEESDATVLAIDSLLRSLRAQAQPANLCVVDYLQLLSSPGRFENRVQEVSYISRELKKIAQRFDIPVLVLSQLRRPERGSVLAEPQLEDLRESGQIEQDSDQVMFLWPSKEPSNGEEMREVNWKVDKNRDGIVNRGTLRFFTKYCRFEESKSKEAVVAA